jgi:tyrosyl-tRNA synthetase
MEQNGISINQEKETDVNRIITKEDFKEGFLIVQKGKKVFLKIELEA